MGLRPLPRSRSPNARGQTNFDETGADGFRLGIQILWSTFRADRMVHPYAPHARHRTPFPTSSTGILKDGRPALRVVGALRVILRVVLRVVLDVNTAGSAVARAAVLGACSTSGSIL